MRQQTGSRNRGWLSAIGKRLSVAAGVALVAGMMAALAPRAEAGWATATSTGATVTNYTTGAEPNKTNWTAHIFTNNGTLTVTSGDVEYLVVGGGGGGGSDDSNWKEGGGGGGGGFTNGTATLTAGDYPVTVGVGGAGSTSGSDLNGVNGSNSVFNGVIAYGGGGGGSGYSPSRAGSGGGCGGGGYGEGNQAGGTGSQGGNGGAGGSYNGGGGGGAGGNGSSGSTPGHGGAGKASSITGVTTNYAGGGGGGGYSAAGDGKDGGGNGSTTGTGGTATGIGCGGGGGNSGGAGSRGIVVVRYVTMPTITVGSTSKNFGDSVFINTTNYWTNTVSGSLLTDNITVSMGSSPAGFEISTNNVDFSTGSFVLATNASGAVPTTNIYVRFTPTSAGAYNGTITNISGSVTQLVTLTATAINPQPVLTVSPSLSLGNVITNKTSTNFTYTLSGTLLEGNVTVTAPSDYFKVATNPSVTFAQSCTVSVTPPTLGDTPIYVQFTPSAGVGSAQYLGSITNSSLNAVDKMVAVTGNGVVQGITLGAQTLAFGNVATNTTSANQSFTVSGSNLEDNVTVTAPSAAFTVSTNASTGFGQSCTVSVANVSSPSGGSLPSTSVYVKFTPSAVGSYGGNITCSSTGAVSTNKAVSGTGFAGKVWTGASSTDWGTAGNWAGGVPTTTDDVLIDGGTRQPTINLTNAVTIKSLVIGPTTASTLTFTNGNVSDKKLLVTGDVTIGATGTVTHAANPAGAGETHRLCLNVGGNVTIAAGGKIDVSSLGYFKDGPGGGGTGGGGYGGEGGRKDGNSAGTTYGSVTNPVNCGSGGGHSDIAAGGGVVRLAIAGGLTLNGSIAADGRGGTIWQDGSGAGGSINISAGTLAGTGTVSAVGGMNAADYGTAGSSGGGRIAIVLTNADDTAYTSLVVRAYGGGGIASGAAGTIYLKGTNQTYGTLIVNNSGGSASRNTLYQTNTNQFDTIITTNAARFVLGTNAQLTMTGCNWLSDTNSKIIVITGSGQIIASTLTIPTNATLSCSGTNRFTLNSEVIVAAGGRMTHETITSTGTDPENHKLIATINGSLNVMTGGQINVSAQGYGQEKGPGGFVDGTRGGGSHGGEGGGISSTTYGSVTNPVRAGTGGEFYNNQGGNAGGVALLIIRDGLTVNGTIAADGQVVGNIYTDGYGAGGSVNIVAASLAGSGTISANGGYQTGTGNGSGGGGGRIAVVLTNADDTAFAGLAAIRAYGGLQKGGYENGAAGTVYLKGTNTVYGRLLVDNNISATRRTLVGPLVTDATVGDVWLRNQGYMSISNGRTLTVYGSWSNAVATNAISGGTVELAGAAPASVWGGNTWSNLTITTANKTVSFQTNVIQYVYGTPAWSNNVTLKSTVDGTYWKLFKPSWGATQDVGVVTVQWSDAMVNTGATFRAAIGSTVSPVNTRNWTAVTPKGTMILLR